MRALNDRWDDRRRMPAAAVLDLLIAAGAAYMALMLAVEFTHGLPGWAPHVVRALALAHGAALLIRRAATSAMLAVLLLTAAGEALLGYPVYLLGPAALVASYTIAVRHPRRRSLLELAGVEAATLVLITGGHDFPGIPSLVLYLGLIAAAWFLGDIAARWRALAQAHAAQVRELQAAREELARHTLTAERLRIARELHDVVAHDMSIVSMHAGAARLAVGQDPDAERAALTVIESTTRGALAEMRRLVTVLRDGAADESGLSPVHGLADLPSLVAGVAAAGVSIQVATSGDLASLPDGISLAGYRVVQEALTNVVRHAAPTQARVYADLRADGMLDLCIENDPGPRDRDVPLAGGGHGMTGMRERVQLYGGTVTSGPDQDGGWRVSAHFPAADAR